ncbi:MAG: hypothetical protein K0V04_44015 [Deltaproteobacteria bacterium]|nr:hypothetical protein [Deltaproteobacteria bacterium]
MNKHTKGKRKLLELNAQTLRTLTGGASIPTGPGLPGTVGPGIPGGPLTHPTIPSALESSCSSGCLSMSHGPKPYTCVPCD